MANDSNGAASLLNELLCLTGIDMSIHIYRSPMQPLTNYTDHTFDPPWECSTPGGRLVYCECCGKRRFARDVVVQCYYDGRRLWCAPGRGCNNPKLIEAKRRREHRNRSRGQKKRWAVVRHNDKVSGGGTPSA